MGFLFFYFFSTEEAANEGTREVGDGEDSASAGRGEGGADGRAPALVIEHDSAPCLHGVPPEGRAPFEALTG